MTLEIQFSGLHTVISGGQTGADQGGLLAAYDFRLRTGGTAPAGYRTATGPNPLLEILGLKHGGDYRFRTQQNIRDSDGTVLIAHDPLSSGSALTRALAARAQKPCLVLSVRDLVTAVAREQSALTNERIDEVAELGNRLATFIRTSGIGTLNVAGNREISTSTSVLPMTFVTRWIVGVALESLQSAQELRRIEP